MSDRWTERLSEYVDGDLNERDRAALEAHLPDCPACRETVEVLRDLLAQAQALPASEPAIDLWPSIAARIEASGRPASMRQPKAQSWTGWRLSLSLPQASLAALGLVAITATTMWWTVGRAPQLVTRGPSVSGARPSMVSTGPAAPSPVATNGTSSASTSPDIRQADAALAAAFSDPQYDATIAELQGILEHERSQLDPKTVEALEKNLKIIDRAVADARRAVMADPSSQYLREHLARVMKQKVTLLRQATQYAFAQG